MCVGVREDLSPIVQIRVVGEAWGTERRTRCTTRQKRRTGQRMGSRVRRWDRESIRRPFFWLRQVTVTKAASNRLAEWWGVIRPRGSLKTRSRISKVLVRPGALVRTTSQGRVAKKKPPMMMSTAWSRTQALTGLERRKDELSRWRCRRNRGVMARWRFGGSSTWSIAFSRAVMEGKSRELSLKCRGLGWRLSRNDEARLLAAVRRVEPARAF
jgi:hypothetical protein